MSNLLLAIRSKLAEVVLDCLYVICAAYRGAQLGWKYFVQELKWLFRGIPR